MIRHGQTEANLARTMAGWIDSPLTALGIEQAHDARQIVEKLEIKPDIIVHSHLSRARDTANIINQNLNIPTIEDADIAEMHAGEWEGAPYEACDAMMKSWQDPPGGESFETFTNRIKRAKNRALQDKYQKPLFVCHGGVFRAFAKLYGVNTWGVENCKLHDFVPAPQNTSFPWEAYSYEINGERKRSASFHGDDIIHS